MRTVNEIVQAVQEQQPATEDELRLALLAVHYAFGIAVPMQDTSKIGEVLLRVRAADNVNLRFRVLKSAPDEYLGPNWTPGTPQNQRQRAQSKRILEAFEKQRGRNA